MTQEIRFYHLEHSTPAESLPALVAKAYEGGHRILIRTKSPAESETLSDCLWSYHPDSFIPHGTSEENHVEKQPVLLSAKPENLNNAGVLIAVDEAETAGIESFSLVCHMFNGNDTQTLAAMRQKWKAYKDEDKTLTYWQQGQRGWEKKA